MNRNDCEAVLHLHRRFLPRRRTGRGFLTATVFLDTALLVCAFVIVISPFVLKPGISLDLPEATGETAGIRFNDLILRVSSDGLLFINDEQVRLEEIRDRLGAIRKEHPEANLILETDRGIPQSTIVDIYDAAAGAGFEKIFIATKKPTQTVP